MAGLWSRKFDYKNGQQRECKVCKEGFHTLKPIWICPVCYNQKQKIIEKAKRANCEKPVKYLYSRLGGEATDRFVDIRRRLRIAWDDGRDGLTEHYSKQIQEIEENGIMDWIKDRRDAQSMKRKQTRKERIQTKWPDTRGLDC